MKKFVVVFHSLSNVFFRDENREKFLIKENIVFGPFTDEKIAKSFIKADIEAGKNFMNKQGLEQGKLEEGKGYGREMKWSETEYCLPNYGEWKIREFVDPIEQKEYIEHCSNFRIDKE